MWLRTLWIGWTWWHAADRPDASSPDACSKVATIQKMTCEGGMSSSGREAGEC